MKIAVVGKGGAGKSMVSGTLARTLARGGDKVLAIDSDPVPGLAISLGLGPLPDAMLMDAVERNEKGRWVLKKGIGPARAVQRFAAVAPDGVRLLQFGKVDEKGMGPLNPSLNGLFHVAHRLAKNGSLSDWWVIGDLPAGPRQMAFNWAPYARRLVLLVDPSWKSILTARRITRIARSRNNIDILPVANRVRNDEDKALIEERLGEKLFAWIPADRAVGRAERRGVALIDDAPDSPAAQSIARLAQMLKAS